jgi:hypothetical protein
MTVLLVVVAAAVLGGLYFALRMLSNAETAAMEADGLKRVYENGSDLLYTDVKDGESFGYVDLIGGKCRFSGTLVEVDGRRSRFFGDVTQLHLSPGNHRMVVNVRVGGSSQNTIECLTTGGPETVVTVECHAVPLTCTIQPGKWYCIDGTFRDPKGSMLAGRQLEDRLDNCARSSVKPLLSLVSLGLKERK